MGCLASLSRCEWEHKSIPLITGTRPVKVTSTGGLELRFHVDHLWDRDAWQVVFSDCLSNSSKFSHHNQFFDHFHHNIFCNHSTHNISPVSTYSEPFLPNFRHLLCLKTSLLFRKQVQRPGRAVCSSSVLHFASHYWSKPFCFMCILKGMITQMTGGFSIWCVDIACSAVFMNFSHPFPISLEKPLQSKAQVQICAVHWNMVVLVVKWNFTKQYCIEI